MPEFAADIVLHELEAASVVLKPALPSFFARRSLRGAAVLFDVAAERICFTP